MNEGEPWTVSFLDQDPLLYSRADGRSWNEADLPSASDRFQFTTATVAADGDHVLFVSPSSPAVGRASVFFLSRGPSPSDVVEIDLPLALDRADWHNVAGVAARDGGFLVAIETTGGDLVRDDTNALTFWQLDPSA